MRVRPPVLYVLSYLIGALLIAEQWLGLVSTAPKILVTVAVAVLLVLAASTQILVAAGGRRARAADEAAATERGRLAAEIHAEIAAEIHAVVVEVVASQQAVVRNAFADDILTRLNTADDNAHAALASLDRLLPAPRAEAETAEPAGTPVPVA